MRPKELQSVIDAVCSKGKMAFLEGAASEQISAFEKEMNVKLPEKYKMWLQYSDGGEFFLPAGIQLYGVAHNPLIDVNCNDRPNDKYVVIGTMSFGDPILFERETERISIYNHEAGQIEEDEIYEDFFAFLNDLADILGVGD